MGARPYYYFSPYQKDIQTALDVLREQEFKAGRYEPAMAMAGFKLTFPPDDTSPAPGARHRSIDEAILASEGEGTRSILDIMRITDEADFLAACPLPPSDLIALFGTAEPSREQIETVLIARDKQDESANDAAMQFWDQINRGEGRYIVLYDKTAPQGIFFAGYSLD